MKPEPGQLGDGLSRSPYLQWSDRVVLEAVLDGVDTTRVVERVVFGYDKSGGACCVRAPAWNELQVQAEAEAKA